MEFGVPCEHAKEYLTFDEKKNNTFNLELARKHHKFLSSLKDHREEMLETVRILKNTEKAFDFHLVDDNEGEHDMSENPPKKNSKQKVNAQFDKIWKNMVERMWEAQQGDEEKFENDIQWLDSHGGVWEGVKDFNGRTILHAPAENENLPMVKTLVRAGVNVNAKEKMQCSCTYLLPL